MAWNKYYIFIKVPKLTAIDEILSRLKLSQYKPVKEVSLLESNKPKTLFVGYYSDTLLIVHPDLVFDFFSDTQSDTERLFIETFPDSEIAALVENSTSNHFSYAVIENGQKVRMKDGGDGEIYHDSGDLLPEEKEILSEQIFSDEDIEEMKENELTDKDIEEMIKFEASWRIPNLLTKRYLGETISEIDINKMTLVKYE